MFSLHHAARLVQDLHDAYFAALEAKPQRPGIRVVGGTDF
jgi:hypothetical protein